MAERTEYTPTRVGMLLLDPDGPYVWAVKSRKVLIRVGMGGIDAQATLTHPFVPPTWKIIDTDDLGRALVGKTGKPTTWGRRLLSDPLGAEP